MYKFLKLLRGNIYLLIAVIAAAVLRFIWLDSVPPAIGGDELNYIITAKYMALKWSHIAGEWNPLSIFIFNYPYGEMQGEISYFIILPFVKFLPLTIFNAKLVSAILSTLTVFVIYALAHELFGKATAIAVAFLSAINPWAIFLGRTSYEMVPETLFYLLSIYLLLKLKGNKIYFTIPILMLAFYSHIATKIAFFPIIISVLVYSYLKNKKYKKQYMAVGIFSLLLVLSFAVVIKTSPSFSRGSEVLTPGHPKIIEIVDYARKSTIDNPLSYIFSNKITYFVNTVITKFIKTISPEYLFVSGDHFYSLYTHGFFYVIDSIFILLGLFFAFVKEKRKFFLLVALSIFSITPHLIHIGSDNFVPQIVLLFPFLIIFGGYGIVEILKVLKNKFLIAIIFIYVVSFFNFANIYFFQFPLKETFDFKIRVLSKYIGLLEEDRKINIYSNQSKNYFQKYLFYSDLINDKNADTITKSLKSKNYNLKNVSFKNCADHIDLKDIAIIDALCKNLVTEAEHLSISRLIDGGSYFRIYNDTVCKKYSIGTYATDIKLSDFSVEKLTTEKFCKTFITK